MAYCEPKFLRNTAKMFAMYTGNLSAYFTTQCSEDMLQARVILCAYEKMMKK